MGSAVSTGMNDQLASFGKHYGLRCTALGGRNVVVAVLTTIMMRIINISEASS